MLQMRLEQFLKDRSDLGKTKERWNGIWREDQRV